MTYKTTEDLQNLSIVNKHDSGKKDENEIAKKTIQDENEETKRHQKYLKMAVVTSLRSKDPCTQVGCVIVDENDQIVSIGYNGFPIGIDDDVFRWDKEDPEDNKHLYVVHAEMNAIINKRRDTLHGCTVYVTLFPCNKCAQMLIQSRVKKVIYIEDRDCLPFRISKRMLDYVNIPYEQCSLPTEKLILEM